MSDGAVAAADLHVAHPPPLAPARGLDPAAGPCHDGQVEKVGEKVLAFRRRFEGIGEADRADEDRDAPTPEIRLQRALQLHDLAVALEISRARTRLGLASDPEIVAEVNRRWVESAAMPISLRERWRTIRADHPR